MDKLTNFYNTLEKTTFEPLRKNNAFCVVYKQYGEGYNFSHPSFTLAVRSVSVDLKSKTVVINANVFDFLAENNLDIPFENGPLKYGDKVAVYIFHFSPDGEKLFLTQGITAVYLYHYIPEIGKTNDDVLTVNYEFEVGGYRIIDGQDVYEKFRKEKKDATS